MVTLIKVSEGVNQLDSMFTDLSNQLNEDIEYQSKVLSGLLGPLLIVFVGALIAVVLIAMYLPMFSMSDILP
ncbi:MAG: type II secretion system F family protein [Flavobacteriales bacterium]|nr:type II secretion system F family protein [Flavobacteriales bacterium]